MKKIFITLFISITIILDSCCDCSVNPVNTEFDCMIREATITEFNAQLVLVDSVYKPGTNFSSHNFLFPDNQYYSGTLINDERFSKTGEVMVSSIDYSDGTPFKAAILDNKPINLNLIGDIMVDQVLVADTSANLKFKGELTRIERGFFSDNAELFCQYIESSKDLINNNISDLSKYGKNIAGAFNPKVYNNNDIKVLNNLNENVTGNQGIIPPSNSDITKLLNLVNSENIAINVRPGDIFIYKSYNGNYFVVLISNINFGILPPNKGRVSIMFNKIG